VLDHFFNLTNLISLADFNTI